MHEQSKIKSDGRLNIGQALSGALTIIIFGLSIAVFISLIPNIGFAQSKNLAKRLEYTDNISHNKKFYTENKEFIILKISKNLKAYVNKKNRKVYYRYNGTYYFWNKGIWFDSKKINGMFGIAIQKDIPSPLRHGPLLKVKRKNIPAGFAALKIPPNPVKHSLPNAATRHLYNMPLTLHGLVIYQKRFNFNGVVGSGH